MAKRRKLLHSLSEGRQGESLFRFLAGAGLMGLFLAGIPQEHLHMLEYALTSQKEYVPLEESPTLDPLVVKASSHFFCLLRFEFAASRICCQALRWQAERTASQVCKEREQILEQLELADEVMRETGFHKSWYEGADEGVKAVSGESNGRLLETLLKAAGYHDVACVYLLKGECACGVLRTLCVFVSRYLVSRSADAWPTGKKWQWYTHGTGERNFCCCLFIPA